MGFGDRQGGLNLSLMLTACGALSLGFPRYNMEAMISTSCSVVRIKREEYTQPRLAQGLIML